MGIPTSEIAAGSKGRSRLAINAAPTKLLDECLEYRKKTYENFFNLLHNAFNPPDSGMYNLARNHNGLPELNLRRENLSQPSYA